MARARRTRLPSLCARLARPAALPWRHGPAAPGPALGALQRLAPLPASPRPTTRGASRELDARSRKAALGAPSGPGADAWRRRREPAPFQAPLAPVSQMETLKPQQAASPAPPSD
ncbi:uncharacterized protein BRD3OS isoform X2 [Macaca mulatta]